MGFLSGSRSKFPNNIDEIKELYDLSPSLKQDAIRYQELIGKDSLSNPERDELQQLTTKLSDYIITAEDRNYFGDVIIKTQKFFKENVQGFITQKQDSFVSFITEKTNDIKEFINNKKTEIQSEIDKFKDLGLWSNTKQYYAKNMVHYEGNTYLAKKDNIGIIPVVADNNTWQLMTVKGDTGYSVNLQPRGDFDTSTNYQKHDIVNYKGNLYYANMNVNGVYPTDKDKWSLFLTGNGEILTNLQTDNKLSLVSAINEVFTKLKQIIQDLTNKYYNKTELNSKFNDMYNAITQGLDRKLGKNDKASDSEKLDGLDSLKFARSYSFFNNDNIPKDVFNNTSHNQSYIGVINYGTEVGFSGNHVKIIYIPHYNDGYGTQIAIPYEGGNYHGVFYRNSIGNKWGSWIELIDTRDRNPNNVGTTTNDANNCLDTGKAYYCLYTQTKNLPFGDNTDDGIIIPYMYSKEQFGFQIYMSWNGTAIYWRRKHFGNWSRWYCIGGGSWNQELIKDSEQVGKYLRWNQYGQNHVIFDASAGVRPDGQACNNSEPDNLWAPTYPYLMGFNGHSTYGIKVNGANWADSANSVQGFPFRNNNGKLEVLVGGEWLSVGAKQYTVTRTGYIDVNSQKRFDYSGGSGILRKITYIESKYSYNSIQYPPEIFLDGVKIDYKKYDNCELEFKNSISIVGTNWQNNGNMGCDFVIQTEK